MKYCWTTISVKDLNKSIDFYQNIIGLKLIRRIQPVTDLDIAFLGEGETQIELVYNKGKSAPEFSRNISMGFVVDSADQMIIDLKSKGIALDSGPFQPNPFIRFFYILDPDGLQIQFVQNITQE